MYLEIFTCREWQPTPVFLPGESHGQRSLAGYSPWGHRESDATLPACTELNIQGMGFPSVLVVKNTPANAGDIRDAGLISGLGRSSGEGNGNPHSVFLPGESHGQRSLAGYSP